MSRDDGIKLIAIYHFVAAALWLLGALAVLLIPLVVVAGPYAPPSDRLVVLSLFGLIFLVLCALAVLFLATGIGLWRRMEWARWAAIVLAILGLLNFPVGTVIGLAILWFLLREDVVAVFRGEE